MSSADVPSLPVVGTNPDAIRSKVAEDESDVATFLQWVPQMSRAYIALACSKTPNESALLASRIGVLTKLRQWLKAKLPPQRFEFDEVDAKTELFYVSFDDLIHNRPKVFALMIEGSKKRGLGVRVVKCYYEKDLPLHVDKSNSELSDDTALHEILGRFQTMCGLPHTYVAVHSTPFCQRGTVPFLFLIYIPLCGIADVTMQRLTPIINLCSRIRSSDAGEATSSQIIG
jgi:hypothetical protein